MEDKIQFDYILDELLLSSTYTYNINPIMNTIYNIVNGVITNTSVIYNDMLYKTLDLNN